MRKIGCQEKGLLRRMRREEDGVALVEFAIVLPLMLLLFGVMVEGGRMFRSYQSANAGIRDAARHVARLAPPSCPIPDYSSLVQRIVAESLSDTSVFASGITVVSASATADCSAGSPYATVSANLSITFPFAGLFRLSGSDLTAFTVTISDQSRVYGL